MVSLRRDARYVEVSTTVVNAAKDHRLRVVFPSEASAETYLADSPFDVVERPIALRPDNHIYRELEVETKPQQSWTAVFDKARGLAVVSVGLPESAVRDLPERPIALTLFRSTGRTVMTDGEPDGQLQGELVFRFAIVPLRGQPDRQALSLLGQRLAAGLRAVQLQDIDVALHRTPTALPLEGGLLQIEGPVVVTSTRQVGEGLEVRMFNPYERPVQSVLRLPDLPASLKRFTQAQRVDFESVPLGEARPLTGGEVTLDMGTKKIVTVRLS